MKKLFIFVLAFALPVYAAGPRSWGKSGTASDTNTLVTVGGSAPFGPNMVCIENTGATNDLYFDWTDGIAATTDNTTNVIVKPGKSLCVTLNNPNVMNRMDIGLICGAAVTTTYNISAFGAR